MPASCDSIIHIRVHAGTRSADRARVRVAGALAAGDLRPPGLPPAATLVVRTLADPRPGTLRVDGPVVEHAATWHAALRDAVAATWATARRPALEAVTAGAHAVRFDDQGELLACLAHDLAGGSIDAWWWSLLLPRRPDGDARAVAQRWHETPHAVPAAAARLAAADEAAGFVARLEPAAARAIAERVAEAHGLAALGEAAGGVAEVEVPASSDGGSSPAAPLARWAPEATLDLGPERAVLLAIALTLARDRASAARPAFAAAVVHALETSPAPALAPASGGDERCSSHHESAGATLTVARAGDERWSRHHESADATLNPAPASTRPGASPTTAAQAHGPPPAAAKTRGAADVPETELAFPGFGGSLERPRPRALRAPGPRPLNPTRGAPNGAGVASAFAGALFLLNVVLALELHGDFTRPRDRGIGMDPWDLVALLGAELAPELRDDALWDVLADLAGREPGWPPGAGFAPPREWRPRPQWLEPFGRPRPPRAIFTQDAVALEHPAGFALLRAARRGLTTDDWIAELARFVRARLALALGGEPLDALRTPGVVHVAAGRVDVVIALDDLPVRARAAGLDRDPGWIPAAARNVAFHFHA